MNLRTRLAATLLTGPFLATAAEAPAAVSSFDPPAPAVRFEFARIKSVIAVGDRIGQISTGLFCTGQRDVRAAPRLDEINTLQAVQAFRDELAASGMAQPARDVSAFDNSPTRGEPDYRVGGVLQALSIDECVNGNNRKGRIDLTVKWEVFAPRLQKVVFTKVVPGSFASDSFETVTGRDFESRAYRASLHVLLSDPELKALPPVVDGAAAPASAGSSAALAPLHMATAKALPGGAQANAAALRAAVATIVHDNVTGSGFYIADGYLLTNRHVVGTTHYVKVRLASGRVLVGEVVRDDGRRDVALVKTEPAGVTPLHVSLDEPPVGENVYAIGSPLGQELAGTFTRGVMSGAREFNGMEFLQSDVAVNPGNSGGPLLDDASAVIGMAVLKIDRAAGLSFFIPIREVANSLQLVFD